jgi:adenine-specific DNA-methyltransferase
LLAARGHVQLLRVGQRRYVGAQIGIYNPSGVKTGRVGHLDNRELLFVVACDGARPLDLKRAALGDAAGLEGGQQQLALEL